MCKEKFLLIPKLMATFYVGLYGIKTFYFYLFIYYYFWVIFKALIYLKAYPVG